jgi:hypothetical protein
MSLTVDGLRNDQVVVEHGEAAEPGALAGSESSGRTLATNRARSRGEMLQAIALGGVAPPPG